MNFWKWGPITIWHNIKCVQFFLLQKSLHPTAPHVVPCCLINDLMLLFRQQAGTQHERNYLIDIYQNYIRIKYQLLKKQYIYRNRVCFGIHMAQFRYSGSSLAAQLRRKEFESPHPTSTKGRTYFVQCT